jgi:hypothetical protein
MTRRNVFSLTRPRWALLAGLILAVLLVALIVIAVFVLPDRLIAQDLDGSPTNQLKPSELLKATDDVRKTLLQGIGGLLFLATAFFTYQQLRVSRDVHKTDQFSKAIDHLGSERMDVRIGGIYALEQIAQVSMNDRERGSILEILSTYVREHAPITPASEPEATTRRHRRPVTPDKAGTDPPAIGHLAADVHAALLVLARRPGAGAAFSLILSGTDLRRCYLAAPKVTRARLSHVHLQESVLQIANLENADLSHADLWKADLRWSNLNKADLRHAYLYEADLRDAELNEADLRHADLCKADFSRAQLTGAKLRGAKTDKDTRWPTGFAAQAALHGHPGP